MSLSTWEDVLARPAPQAAKKLIGWHLIVGKQRARITETEAYHTEADRACHASKGRTTRTSVLYERPGTLYIYLCYGMHWLLNLVCYKDGIPSAVLIRGVAIDGINPRRSNGPGKVCAVLGLNGSAHGRHLSDGVIALREPSQPVGRILRGPRVGVDYAGPQWAAKPWRFWEVGFPVAANRLIATPQSAPRRNKT